MTVNVKDAGAVGDGVTDDTAAIRHAIKDASEKGPGAAVYLPAGNYLLASGNVHLDNLHDFTFYGDGAASVLLEKDPNQHDINMDGSKNVTIRNLVLSRSDDYFSQGTIDSVNPANNTVSVTLDPNYPEFGAASLEGDHDIRVYRAPDTGYYDTSALVKGSLPLKLDDHKWQIHVDHIGKDFVGRHFIYWTDHLGGHGIGATGSRDCLVQDVTYYGRGSNAGLILYNCDGTMTFRRFNIDVPPGSNGILSCSGGGMEIDTRGKLVYDQCDFEHFDDDGADITTHDTAIVAQPSPTTITVASNENFHVGDSLAHLDWITKIEQPGFKIVKIEPASDGHGVNLTLDQPMTVVRMGRDQPNIPFEEVLKNGYDRVVDYNNVTTSTEFHHCKFQCLRARPLNLKAQNCLVDGCTFYNCDGAPISAGPEAAWMEAPYVHNLTIRNCTFTNNVLTCIDIDYYQGMKECISYGNENILIEGNKFHQSGAFVDTPKQDPSNWRTIENFGALAIHLHHCNNVTIRNNDFGDRASNAPDYNPMVLVDHCKNVTIENNQNLPDNEVKQQDSNPLPAATPGA